MLVIEHFYQDKNLFKKVETFFIYAWRRVWESEIITVLQVKEKNLLNDINNIRFHFLWVVLALYQWMR